MEDTTHYVWCLFLCHEFGTYHTLTNDKPTDTKGVPSVCQLCAKGVPNVNVNANTNVNANIKNDR